LAVSSDVAKTKVNAHNKAQFNAAVKRWYIERRLPGEHAVAHRRRRELLSNRPAKNPVNNLAYALNAVTHRVN
jgi:hypothetical protein